MADLTITASAIIAASGATTDHGTAGASITAGVPVYKDATDSNKIKPADANDTAAKAACVGIALHAALTGQPIRYITAGGLGFGAILTVGETYAVSENVGMIAPIGDVGTGEFVTILGVATTTSNLNVDINATGIQKG